MEMHRDRRGFPGADSGASRTPHSRNQLSMTGWRDSSDGPSDRIVRLHDPQKDEYRPAVICFPGIKGSSYAIVHTAADRPRQQKCRTQSQYENALTVRIETWDAPSAVRRLVDQAKGGEFDSLASREGFQSPLSFVMYVVEVAESPANLIQRRLLAEEGVVA